MKVKAYKNVFNRDEVFETTFEVYLNHPEQLYEHFGLDKDTPSYVPNIKDKHERNIFKRERLVAIEFSECEILAIDIDDVADDAALKQKVIDMAKELDSCFIIKESVSGNILLLFKYECGPADFSYLYYKLYLQLTLLFSVNIDFLPEIKRLRYVGNPGYIYKNDDAKVLTDMLKVKALPYIKVRTQRTPGVIYKSC